MLLVSQQKPEPYIGDRIHLFHHSSLYKVSLLYIAPGAAELHKPLAAGVLARVQLPLFVGTYDNDRILRLWPILHLSYDLHQSCGIVLDAQDPSIRLISSDRKFRLSKRFALLSAPAPCGGDNTICCLPLLPLNRTVWSHLKIARTER